MQRAWAMSNLSPTHQWFHDRYQAAVQNGADDLAKQVMADFLDWSIFQDRYDQWEHKQWVAHELARNASKAHED